MSRERERFGFWAFAADNPVMLIIFLVLLLGLVAIIMGYREGFASVLTGLFGFLKKDDADRRLQERELEARQAEAANRAHEQDILRRRDMHDGEVEADAASAKAECDEMDIDELVDVGNALLRDAGIGGGSAS